MAFFNFKKKRNEGEKKGCCCCGNVSEESMAKAEANMESGAKIKILGSGCAKCNELEKSVVEAVKELGLNEPIDHVTKFEEIAAYGVMTTPALVVDNKVVSYGKVLKKDEVVELIKKTRNM